MNDSFARALKALVVERDRIEKAIAALEELLRPVPARRSNPARRSTRQGRVRAGARRGARR